MSFKDLKLTDLKAIAENFAIDMPQKVTKNDLILLLQEEGVTYEDYERFANVEKVKPDLPVRPTLNLNAEENILVKMDRENHSFQVGGVTFTREHPFMAVPKYFADELFMSNEGFRPATPREIQEYYS